MNLECLIDDNIGGVCTPAEVAADLQQCLDDFDSGRPGARPAALDYLNVMLRSNGSTLADAKGFIDVAQFAADEGLAAAKQIDDPDLHRVFETLCLLICKGRVALDANIEAAKTPQK